MSPRFSPEEIAASLGLPAPTEEQHAVITGAAEPTLVVAGAGAGKTETMASRVVWLVANGLAGPAEILGLTFTRKAAQQLSRRIRRRLDALATSPLGTGSGAVPGVAEAIRTADPQIATYHSYAGTLVGSYGLLLPVEPDSRLLSETSAFQLAHDVVSSWEGPLSGSMSTPYLTGQVLTLAGRLSDHLVSTADLRAVPDLLSGFVGTLPKGPRQRSTGPNSWLLECVAAQDVRSELADLVDAVEERMRSEGALDFGSQMSLAARIAQGHADVGAAERRAFRVVLLDEYQDTGHSQRVMLSSLFGRGADDTPAVTAVGDPMQSIYGWRGASSSNLQSFLTDFPLPDGRKAHRLTLSTSWRNPPEVLDGANAVSLPLRAPGSRVDVPDLRPRPGAAPGDVRVALAESVAEEREWVADRIRESVDTLTRERAGIPGAEPPTAAVLVRRNADSAPIAEALRARGLEVEIVGVGGLLDVPEVADVVALLRVVAHPSDGTSVLRLLTGVAFRLGAADLSALAARARMLSTRRRGSGRTGELRTVAELDQVLADLASAEETDVAGLADALADPGPAEAYSEEGRQRIERLARTVATLRAHHAAPPARLVAAAEQALGLDVEVRVRRALGAGSGREHLDALHSAAAGYGSGVAATLAGFLDHLELARIVESGLARGEVEVSPGRVQILTVHSAKGLEWEIVAVPHVCRTVFPSERTSETSLRTADQLPESLRGDRVTESTPDGAPVLDLATAVDGDPPIDRKELEDALKGFIREVSSRAVDEDRRLFYVAVTRSERHLLVSGHHWAGGARPLGPSELLVGLAASCRSGPGVEGAPGQDDGGIGVIEKWAPEPTGDRPDGPPPVSAQWPTDVVRDGGMAESTRAAARAVREATAQTPPAPSTDLEKAWSEEASALLEERRWLAEGRGAPVLPRRLTASEVVAVVTDAEAFADRLRRPVPFKPDRFARRGTRFHSWLEHRFGATHLLDIDDLPGAGDDGGPEEGLVDLQEAFEHSPWALRTPVEVEVPFEVSLGRHLLRGRMDAVFAEEGPEGRRWVVVDWKTGRVPSASRMPSVAVQLAVYRHAWAGMLASREGMEIDPSRVRAVFHYVRDGLTVEPPDLPDAEVLVRLLDRESGR